MPLFEYIAAACENGNHIHGLNAGIRKRLAQHKYLRFIGSDDPDVQQLTLAWPNAVGRYDYKHTIYFTGESAESQVLTILHEMIHFTCYQLQFKCQYDLTAKLDEIKQCESMA